MQSVQLHIFHQVSFYSSVRALCGLSYNCFSGTRDNLGKLGPNTPNHVQGHMKSNPKSSNVYFTSNETLFQFKALFGVIYTYFTGTGTIEETGTEYWGNFKKLGLNTSNHAEGHMKSNPKSSASHFTSNQLLLQSLGSLTVELYLFYRYLGIRAIQGNWAQIPEIM